MYCGVDVLKDVKSCCGVDLGLLAGLGDQRLRRVVEGGAAAAREILDLEFEAAGGAEPGDRGRIEAQRERLGNAEQLRPRTCATMAEALLRRRPRSSHGLRMANSTAELDCAALVRKFRPLIEPTMSTPGVACRMSRTFLATASVRSSDAPSGSWTTTKK